jgi:hypothetical protein
VSSAGVYPYGSSPRGGLSVKKSTPRGVCSIAHDHHFGLEVQGRASLQHIAPAVWGTGKGIFTVMDRFLC